MKFRSYISPKCAIQESALSGRGLHAVAPISAGEVIVVKSGHIVSTAEAKRIDETLGDFSLQIADGFFLAPTTDSEIADFVVYHNHSCEPNIGPEGQICFVTLRDIEPGEELCSDYAMTICGEGRHPYRLECHCGSRLCRGEVTSDDWKRKDLQKRYGLHFSPFILRRIYSSSRLNRALSE